MSSLPGIDFAPPNFNHHLRRLDLRHDLSAVADLVELCFHDTLDAEGRNYLKQMRQAAQHTRLMDMAGSLYNEAAMPPSGLVWEEECPDSGKKRLVGNLSLIPINLQGKRGYLVANVAVHPDFRGRGIGRALTEAAVEAVRGRGAPAAWLQVRHDNPSAIHIYQTCGFKERARRSSWTSTGAASPANPGAGVTITPRQATHWALQKAWLRAMYPAELSWHLHLDWKSLPPGWEGMLYRFFTWEYPRHWAAMQDGRLAALLTWIRSGGSADQLWLASPQEVSEPALAGLLTAARRALSSRRPLALNLPAGLGEETLRQAGFTSHQTLIWMEYRFSL